MIVVVILPRVLALEITWDHALFSDHSRKHVRTRGISAFNFRWFQQPITSWGNVITANQRYGQNLAVTSTNVREFVSGPILAVAVRENVWEPLKLGLISGYAGECRSAGNKLSNVKCLIILLSGEGLLTSFSVNNSTLGLKPFWVLTFLVKKSKSKLSGVSFF